MKPLKIKRGNKRYRVFAPPGYEGAPKRKPYYFESRAPADAFCDVLKRWQLRKSGRVRTVEVTDEDTNWLGYLKNELGQLSLLPDVVRHWKLTSTGIAQRKSVTELCAEFEALQAAKNLKPTTLAEIRSKLKNFRLLYGGSPAHEIDPAEMERYLLNLSEGWTRKGHYKWLRAMFDYAKDIKATTVNPFAFIDAPKRVFKDIEIYTPADFRKLLTTADKEYPEMIPWLALLGFNFMRQCELIPAYPGDDVLRCDDFLLLASPPQIRIRPEVAKQTKRSAGDKRYVPIQDSTRAWLNGLVKPSTSPVLPFSTDRKFQIAKARLFRSAGVKTISNGLRHSCISYYLAAHPETGVALTAKWAGNSEAVSRSFYDARLMPEDGSKWFGIRR